MAYETDPDVLAHKTGRIAILSILVFSMCAFLFAYKVDACRDKPTDVACKDEFYEITNDSRSNNNHTCSPGAVVEVVNSPPAPRPGIICHCPTVKPGGSNQGDK